MPALQRQATVGEGESAVLEICQGADSEVTPLRAVAADDADENVITEKHRRWTAEEVQAPAAAIYGEGGRIETARRP
jgi:hypothetical protein